MNVRLQVGTLIGSLKALLSFRKAVIGMGLTILMLISVHAFAQNVTLKEQNTSIERVLEKMKREHGLDFIGDMSLFKRAKPVSIQVENRPIQEVLNQLSKGQPFELILSKKTIYLKEKAQTAERNDGPKGSYFTLVGTVTDANNKPIEGVTVKLQNSSNWASVTSDDGSYAVEAFDNSQIHFSMQGFESVTVNVAGKRHINVQLKERNIAIEETVITGYSRRSKESYTGASTTITRKDLEKFNNRNILSVIESLDPSFKIHENNSQGSNPNNIADITVRGQNMVAGSSLGSSERGRYAVNSPLVIIDGFESSMERLYDMDPNRIESISILKDATATALYGSRGANGVLVLETRLPKDGKFTISYSQQPSTSIVDLSDYNLMNAMQKLEYEKLSGLYHSESTNTLLNLQSIYQHRYQEAAAGVNTDWIHQPVQSKTSLAHSIRVEGGNDRVRYSIDGNYGDTKGVMKESGRQRAGAGFNLLYRIANKLSFRNLASFSNVKAYNSPYGSLSTYSRINPYYRIYNEAGELNRVYNLEFYAMNGKPELVYNPLYDAGLPYIDESNSTVISNNLNLEYYILPELRVVASGMISKTFAKSEMFRSPNHSSYFEATDITQKGVYSYGGADGYSVLGNLNVNYGKTFGKHILSLMANTEVKSTNQNNTGYSVIGFMDDDFISPKMAARYSNSNPPYENLVTRLMGMMLNGTYNYDNRLILEGTYRVDGSSAFGKDNRFSSFWSTGLAYNLHREKFMENSGINMLRLFGNYGVSGADSFLPGMTSTSYEIKSNNLYYQQVGFLYSGEGNHQLRWPQIYSLSAGIEGALFNSRLNVKLNAYHKLTKNMVSEISVAPSLGLHNNTYFENMGEVTNKGIEAYINLEAYRNSEKGFSWFINASGARNINKLTKISEALRDLNEQNNNDYGVGSVPQTPYYQEGESLDNIKGVLSLGIDPATGKEVYQKLDGSPTFVWSTSDLRVLANGAPKLNGTIGTTINYKGFSLQGILYYVLGQHVYNSTLVDKVESVEPKYNVDLRVLTDRWKNPGDQTFFKDIADRSQTQLTSRFLQKENTLRLASLNLNYDFSKEFVSKLKLQRLRLNASTNDLFRFSTIRMERGTSYPFSRSINFGIYLEY